MCGRAYQTYTDEELEMRYLNTRSPKTLFPERRPNYNMAPTHLSPVLLIDHDNKKFELLRWGLIPGWAKDVKSASKYSLINARLEDIETKRTYKAAFEKRRCIIPLSGFIEWAKLGAKKTPMAIHLKDNSILSVAGIYERWIDRSTGEHVDSFSIVTTNANTFMRNIHDRMPLIIEDKNIDQWLDPKLTKSEKIKTLLEELNEDLLDAYEISTQVNSPKNNSPEILKPSLPTSPFDSGRN